MEKKIRLRFAPSPTGPLHMGGVRTALFNYLFAKKHGGDFLLRIEDTDQTRFVPGAEDYIIESLKWCGIHINEGVSVGGPYAPYRQSERKEIGIYQQYAQQLIDSGNAYYAFDSNEDLDAARKTAEAKGTSFSYNHETRMLLKNSLTLSEDETKILLNQGKAVIRLKVPVDENIQFNDIIRGDVNVNSNTVDDKVLIKSDGMPTYHLAHIVDDYLMQITHAVRGEEWLPSAPAHVLIYRFLGWEDEMPQYAHLPLLLKPDGNGKLSKRDGDKLGFPVFPLQWTDPATGEISSGYREKGYLPEAFVNMLAFLGWNPGTEQELFTMSELIENFSFVHVHKSGAKFNPEKTLWFNSQYIKMAKDADLAKLLKQQLQGNISSVDENKLTDYYLAKAVHLIKPRIHYTTELHSAAPYLFVATDVYDEQVIQKKWKPELKTFFNDLIAEILNIELFDATNAETTFKNTATKHEIKAGDVLQLFRVMLSGQGSGVDLFGMVALLGKQEVQRRIETAINKFSN